MTWQTEFGTDYDVPEVILNAGLTDYSWHNDACPAFYHLFDAPKLNDDDLAIWCEHPDPEKRDLDCLGGRFMVTDATTDNVYWVGDDASEALAQLRAQVAKRETHSDGEMRVEFVRSGDTVSELVWYWSASLNTWVTIPEDDEQ